MSPLGFPIHEAVLTGLISWGFLGDHSCSALWQWSCLIQREQLHLLTVSQRETLVSVKSAGRTSKRRLLWRCKEYTVDLGLLYILNAVSFPGIGTWLQLRVWSPPVAGQVHKKAELRVEVGGERQFGGQMWQPDASLFKEAPMFYKSWFLTAHRREIATQKKK